MNQQRPPLAADDSARTPMAFVRAIVTAYTQRGLSAHAALAAAQIAPALIDQPLAHITALQMERISDHAMRELDDEALGWFSRRLPWGSYGMLARASISSPTLGVALQRWCRHHGLLTDDITLHLPRPGGDEPARISLHKHRPLGVGGALREFCVVSVLRNLHGVACWLVDSRIPLLGAQFPFEPPPHAEVYPLLFPGPIRFGADTAGLQFDARYLSLPLRRDEAALRQMLQRALPLTVRQYRRDRLLVQRVRQLLASHPAQTHSADDLAALLHLSPRTLHRQLKDEGAALQTLKDEVRRERATELLLRSQRPVKQIAEAVGFQNEKSFIRAFQSWTGSTPGEFRARD